MKYFVSPKLTLLSVNMISIRQQKEVNMSHNKAVLIGVGFAGCKILSKIKSDITKHYYQEYDSHADCERLKNYKG